MTSPDTCPRCGRTFAAPAAYVSHICLTPAEDRAQASAFVGRVMAAGSAPATDACPSCGREVPEGMPHDDRNPLRSLLVPPVCVYGACKRPPIARCQVCQANICGEHGGAYSVPLCTDPYVCADVAARELERWREVGR